MPSFSIKDLAKIIERDSKDATYKYALLRGSIEIIQENDNYKKVAGSEVSFPLGLLVLKWIEYYYPLINSKYFIPQKHGDSKERSIAFRRELEEMKNLYPTADHPAAHALHWERHRAGRRDIQIQQRRQKGGPDKKAEHGICHRSAGNFLHPNRALPFDRREGIFTMEH